MQHIIINTDGACAGNPGPMGIGVALIDAGTNNVIETHASDIGHGTNNIAEYTAVITGLEMLCAYPEVKHATVRSDSQLVIKQLNGEYRIKNKNMQDLAEQVRNVLAELDIPVKFEWVPRDKNPIADALASSAIGMPQASSDESGVVLWDSVALEEPDQKQLVELPVARCAKDLARFYNSSKEAKFAEFMVLKPGGVDSYSKQSRESLVEIIGVRYGKQALNWLETALREAEEAYALNALRWAARGLRPDLALKKAAVDVEVSANRKQVRSTSRG